MISGVQSKELVYTAHIALTRLSSTDLTSSITAVIWLLGGFDQGG
jgi:hypothetical protein